MKNNTNKTDLTKIFEQSVIQHSLANDATFSEMKEYKRDGIHYIEVDFKWFKAVFVTGNTAYGYSFFEGSDPTPDNGVIVRFKFDFSNIYFSPYDIHNALDLRNFEILDFHISQDEFEIEANVDRLFRFINEYSYQLEEFARYPIEQQKLLDCYMHDLQVASKRIYEKGLEEKTQKRLRSHEIDLFYHQALAPYFSELSKGKSKNLKSRFEKLSQKGKLLMYEERYYKYLEAHDYQFTDELTKNNLSVLPQREAKLKRVNPIIILFSVIFCIVTSILIESVVTGCVFNGYTILTGGDSEMFVVPVATVYFFVALIFDKIHEKKYGKTLLLPHAVNKRRLILSLLCIGVLAFCLFVRIDEAHDIVGINENQVIISEDMKSREVCDIKNDRVKFIKIDGYYDENNELVEERDFIIVVDDDYKNYLYTDIYGDDLQSTIDIIEKNNAFAEEYKTVDEFLEEYELN